MFLLPPFVVTLPPSLTAAVLMLVGIAAVAWLVAIFAESGNDLW